MAKNKDKKTKPSYAEQLDIPIVTLKEAQDQIELSLRFQQHRGCIVLVGESGLGKTQIFGQVARKFGYSINPIHTAQYNLMGAGIPRKAEGDFFDIALPSVFPKPGEKSIVLFDEINRGLKHAIAMFFNLLEDRTMFNYKLPDECVVAATMNPANAAYAVSAIENEPAIRRRVKFLWVTSSPSDWLRYAETDNFHHGEPGPACDKPCHPDILAYYRANPKRIYDVKAQEAGKQYACPATVQTVSTDAYCLDSAKISLTGETARTRYSASIGLTETQQLISYLMDNTVIIGADVVLYQPDKAAAAINKLKATSQHEKLADLAENVLTLLFSDMPENVRQTSANFLSFCKVLPLEQAASFCQQMRAQADTSTKLDYLKNLLGELQHFDDWTNLQIAFDTVHQQIDAEVQSK